MKRAKLALLREIAGVYQHLDGSNHVGRVNIVLSDLPGGRAAAPKYAAIIITTAIAYPKILNCFLELPK